MTWVFQKKTYDLTISVVKSQLKILHPQDFFLGIIFD
jgi:hypothetical protein